MPLRDSASSSSGLLSNEWAHEDQNHKVLCQGPGAFNLKQGASRHHISRQRHPFLQDFLRNGMNLQECRPGPALASDFYELSAIREPIG